MRMCPLLLVCVGFVLTACDSPQWPRERRATMNRWMVEDYQSESIRGGVIAQHTLYPHHFVEYGAALNSLGERDLDILADHYRANPGELNVRREGTADALYEARLATVKQTLTAHGVDADRVTIADAQPGGPGMASEFVVVILKTKMDKPLTQDDADSGFVTGSTAR